MTSDRKEYLRRIAEGFIRQARQERLDSPNAMMWAVKALREVEPHISEAEAFDLVWSLWQP